MRGSRRLRRAHVSLFTSADGGGAAPVTTRGGGHVVLIQRGERGYTSARTGHAVPDDRVRSPKDNDGALAFSCEKGYARVLTCNHLPRLE